MFQLIAKGILALGIISPLMIATAFAADPLPAQTRFVALKNSATFTQQEFDVAGPQDLVITLADFELPAAFVSASIVVTQGDTIAGQATLAPPSKTAVVSLNGATGHFVARVVGTLDPANSIGFFGVCVAPKTDPANCIQSASFSGNVAAKSAASDPTISTLSLDFAVATAGIYTVTATDFAFPAALAAPPNMALFQGSQLIAAPIASGSTVPLTAGNYRLYSIGQADPAIKAGLYGITIAGTMGEGSVIDDSFPVGSIEPFAAVNNPVPQTLFLKVSDFNFPAPLASASALVTFGGTQLAAISAGTAVATLLAPASTATTFIKVWRFAAAGADAGTYSVDLSTGSAGLFSATDGVSLGSTSAYAFSIASPGTGTYQASTSDFEFPAALQSLKFAVVQNGAILQQSTTAGSLNVAINSGQPVIFLVAAKTPATGNGLFDVNLQTIGGTPQLLFDKTQGVSADGLFDSQQLTLGTNGDFDVTLSDLKFPGTFQDLNLVVSRAGTVLGKIFGGGTFPIQATPGTYQLTFVATPAAKQSYGLYGLKIVASAPAVTLTGSPLTLTAGESTTLTWTSSDADSCTASGGNWTGNKAVNSGTEVVKVDATATFTLTCTGAGGSSAKTVSVTATPKAAGSGGGGGSMDWYWLALLALVLALRVRAPLLTIRLR